MTQIYPRLAFMPPAMLKRHTIYDLGSWIFTNKHTKMVIFDMKFQMNARQLFCWLVLLLHSGTYTTCDIQKRRNGMEIPPIAIRINSATDSMHYESTRLKQHSNIGRQYKNVKHKSSSKLK